MNIIEKKVNQITVLELAGKIDVNSSKIFQEKFTEITTKGEKNIILNCLDLNYVSSSGLRVFLMFLKHVNKLGGKLVLCSMGDIIYEVFEISGFIPIFTIVSDIEMAFKEF